MFTIKPESVFTITGIRNQKKSQLSLSITAPKSLQSLLTSANLLLTRKIKPSKPIQDLLDDHLLQDWVKQGRKHHEAKRETCGFCGNALPTNLWSKLDAHFDLESEKLESSLRLKVNEIDELLDTISDELPYEQSDFYSEYGNDLKTIKNDLKTENRNYKKQLSAIKKALIKRQKNIFESPRVHRRPVCLSQATLPDSFKLS